MSAVSNSVMPTSRAACTTSAVRASSIRIPKLLQPSPTTETCREPSGRESMAAACPTGCLHAEGTASEELQAQQHQYGGAHAGGPVASPAPRGAPQRRHPDGDGDEGDGAVVGPGAD